MSLSYLLTAPTREFHVAVDEIGKRMAALDTLLDLNEIAPATRVALGKEYDEIGLLVDDAREDDLVKAEGTVVTVGSLVFLLWSRLRLVLNDAEWCAEDKRYRTNPQEWASSPIFCADNMAATPFDYHNKHPRYEYTQSELRLGFMKLLTAPKLDDVEFTKEIYGMMVDRVCVMLNYTIGGPTADVEEYSRVSNFLYDCYYLIANINRKLVNLQTYDRRPNAKFNKLLAESRLARTKWATGMVLTAAGDDLAVVYKVMVSDQTVETAERHIHARSHAPSSSYNVLVETRGREAGVRINNDADNFIIDMIRHEVEDEISAEEYSSQATALVEERYAGLTTASRNKLDGVLFDYTTKRLLGLDFFGHVVTETAGRAPTLTKVCYTDKWVLRASTGDAIGVFESINDAFAVWLWWIGMHHGGIVYHPEPHAEIDCTEFIRAVLWPDEV